MVAPLPQLVNLTVDLGDLPKKIEDIKVTLDPAKPGFARDLIQDVSDIHIAAVDPNKPGIAQDVGNIKASVLNVEMQLDVNTKYSVAEIISKNFLISQEIKNAVDPKTTGFAGDVITQLNLITAELQPSQPGIAGRISRIEGRISRLEKQLNPNEEGTWAHGLTQIPRDDSFPGTLRHLVFLISNTIDEEKFLVDNISEKFSDFADLSQQDPEELRNHLEQGYKSQKKKFKVAPIEKIAKFLDIVKIIAK